MMEKRPDIVKKEITARRYIPFKAGESVLACVLTKVGKPNQGSAKDKRASRGFRKRNTVQTVRRSDCGEP